MPLIQSIRDARFQQVILTAQQQKQFQSPVEWRNTWIYFILVDRFEVDPLLEVTLTRF